MTDVKGAVQEKFSPAASNYRTSPIHAQGQDLQWMVQAAALRGDEQVLDLGCGAGHASLAFAPHVGHVIASDFTPAMLIQVEHLAAERGVKNVETRLADAEALPFDRGAFDVVISRLSAHHWPHPETALQEVVRVLKPGGQFILSDAVAPEEPALDTFLQTFELLRDQSHVRDHSVAQWEMMFSCAGLEPKVVRTWDIAIEFDPWIARIAAPALNTAMIKRLFDEAPQEVRTRFEIQPDYAFILFMALFHGQRQ